MELRRLAVKHKILTILGSPRRKGNSALLAEQVSEGAKTNGAMVETVYLNGLKIKPCQACKKCKEANSNGCVISDDMDQLYPKIKESDIIVIASPIYWFNISAQSKIFIDRLYGVWSAQNEFFKEKKFAIILTFGDPNVLHSGTINVYRFFQDMFRYIGATFEDIIFGCADKKGEIIENKKLMEKAYLMGKNF